MTKVLDKQIIEKIINNAPHQELISNVEDAFAAYSSHKAVVPPVGTLTFNKPPADMHIKYGYIANDSIYVVKIASGFYNNPDLGLPSSNGLNLVFNKQNGLLEAILLDEGILTNVRTAVAGSIAAKYMAPEKVHAIGIIGSGIQARLQLKYLKNIVNCNKVYVWGIHKDELQLYKEELSIEGYNIVIAPNSSILARECNLIITTTPSTSPLIFAEDIQRGTHITAIGADTIGKQELDTDILKIANHIVVDSTNQCCEHGEIHKAVKSGLLNSKKIKELGNIIKSGNFKRKNTDVSVADLTGIATQDIQISKFILNQLSK